MEEEEMDDLSGTSGNSLEITLVSVRVGWLYFNPMSNRGRVIHLMQVRSSLPPWTTGKVNLK